MRIAFTAAFVIGTLAAAPAAAEIVHYVAKLDAASETPPKDSNGVGAAQVTLDTDSKQLAWKIGFSNLTGPATMAHFHGPAAPGVAAGVTVPIGGPMASPLVGDATLTDVQIGDLRAGLWYINIHTAKYPGGEIRGQVVKAP